MSVVVANQGCDLVGMRLYGFWGVCRRLTVAKERRALQMGAGDSWPDACNGGNLDGGIWILELCQRGVDGDSLIFGQLVTCRVDPA